ncbi:MAG: glucosaminidase domain-containing protein [Lachnospira eligens]
MKVIPKLQQGNTIESDNTKVVRPEIHEPIKAKPRQYSIVDLGGEPSNDTRSAAERNRDYWHPIKGAKARFRASMSNETNPLVGIERTILPSAAGAALVTTPAAVVGGALGNMTVDKLTGGWGNWLEDKTGIPSEIGVYTNPGAWYGGAKGYKIGKDKLITKSIKGDADLAWNPINKNHWIFNKEARTPSNIAMATANRITPFLSKVEKLPLKVAAYKAAKRTNGNASVSLQDIKTMPADYTGSSILGGGNLEGRNLLAKYIFDENPVVKRMFFNKATSNIKPISRNEARRGFSHGDRYEQLYPGVHNRRYEMSAVVPSGRPLKFENVTKFTDYAGKNPIGKVVGKETEPVMRMGDKEFMTFRQPGTDYIGPIDDVAGHLVKFQMNKGKLRQTSQDMWKFNPADYAKRWNDSPNTANQVRLTKQAALMDKVGRPFILQQSNPIWIEGKSVRNPELVTMAHGGRFDFKKSPLLKKQEEINGKRDMRKKFIKSSRPTYKKRIKKAQQGMKFVSYNPVSNPTIDYTDITNPINPFSEYNYNTTYDKPTALVVPTREDSKPNTVEEPDVVANNPTVEPVINKPVASKPVTDKPVTKTANSTWKSPYTNRKQWSTELINAYKKAGITNDNAIRMLLAQDALESSWGKSAQGKYNFGNLTTGSSWKGDYVTGNDKNAKGEAIKQKFRSYNSMDEYAADKIQFLKRLYDFDENDDINKFVAKLTGSNKGKRRYAEAKEYANSLRGVYNSFKAGGIIKYQEPAQPIARRDAIKDYRPEIPLSPIKQPVKPYMPTQQPVLSSDNRTGWEKEVSRQIKADKAKNDKLYGNQHTWNWSAPFTNARITKDNASAIFDFDKSAAMSTFAIGQGIASPVTTATSIAGSLVGAGIGNRVAGEKGALVGGFVGGMVNPRFRFGKSSSTKRREHGNVADNVNLHSKMNFDDYDQIVNAIDNEEELYRLYLQNETVAKRIREVSPSYVKEVNNFIKTKIKKRFGKPTNGNYQAANRVADDAPEVTFGGVPFKYQENVYNIEPGKPIPHLEFVAHENSHGIDRAVSRLLSTDYLRNLLNPSDKLPFNKWINEVKKSKAVVDYIKRSRNLDVNNPADYSKIEKEVYKYFSDPTEIKAYFSRIPFEKYKKSVDRSFDGKVINNPVSKDIFQITDADILDDVRLQLIASIYKRNDMASYEALKSNLTNKLWGVSALGIPAINTLINGYE